MFIRCRLARWSAPNGRQTSPSRPGRRSRRALRRKLLEHVENDRVGDSQPKTDRSAWVLPLTPALKAALRRAETEQKIERMKLGPDYGPGEHVVVDEAGPSIPSRHAQRLLAGTLQPGEGEENPVARRTAFLRVDHARARRPDRSDLRVARTPTPRSLCGPMWTSRTTRSTPRRRLCSELCHLRVNEPTIEPGFGAIPKRIRRSKPYSLEPPVRIEIALQPGRGCWKPYLI